MLRKPQSGKGEKKSQVYLLRHCNKNIHSDGPRLTFECPQCGNSFGSKRTLNQHVNFAHKGKDSQTHECECGKSFVNKGNLNKHKRTHNATKTAKVRMAVG
eukprot:Platyproteum_vivax@DN7384_c1_g1_i3.p2